MHNRIHRWCVLLLVFWLALPLAQPATAQATWLERRTTNFAILYPEGSEAEAERYAQFVDGVYDEISAIFGYRAPTPVPLRIYPTMDLYVQVNPLAGQVSGVVAHAHTGRREISIALPQTVNQSPEQIVNNVRHETAHIFAADLSGGRLTTGFQEGVAQYVERPTAELDAKMQLMRKVIDAGRLLSWSHLNLPGVAYEDPQVAYPESYTIVAFLVRRDGFATLRRFIEEIKSSSGYRGALEAAYNTGADQLEAEWRTQLDTFVNGDYKQRAAVGFDLSHAESLLAAGEFERAIVELEAGLATLQQAGDVEVAARAEQLLRLATGSRELRDLVASARAKLEAGDYDGARQAATEGYDRAGRLQLADQMAVMDEYARLADQGSAAQSRLRQAHGALQTLHVDQARQGLTDAYRTFTRLGDEANAALALTSLLQIQRVETAVSIVLVVIAALILGWNVHRRYAERGKALPFG